MRLEHLLNQYNDRVAGPHWYPFVGFVDLIHSELGESTTSVKDNRELTSAQEKLQYGYLENVGSNLFQRLVAAELLGLLTIDIALLERSIASLLRSEREDDDQVVAALVAHLMFAIEFPSLISRAVREGRRSGFIQRTQDLCKGINLTLAKRSLTATAPTAPSLQTIRTFQGMLPGDCLFRRQSRPWYGNPFRDFGHAGIYVGCADPSLDVSDCSNHIVIHVVSAKPACQMTNLQEFCNPDGSPEQFWGAYQADLSSVEREAVLQTAYAFVNGSTYAFTKGYKNSVGKSFRCDGFVEHCYESALPAGSPLSYRGGLFEGDDWETMNPKALRSCLIRKVAADIAPCCSSKIP